MSKSNRGGSFGRRSGGTVTVIEEPVRRSAVRKAKIVFWICWITIGLLAATVLASKWHPILALLAGIGHRPGCRRRHRRAGDRLAGPARPVVVDPRNRPDPRAWSPAGLTWPTTPPCPSASRSSSPSPAFPPRSRRSAAASWPPCGA